MRYLFVMFVVLSLAACKKDFDETEDSTQRSVTFVFDSDQLFSDLLSRLGDSYSKGKPADLPTDRQLRLACYCYDGNSELIAHKTIIAPISNSTSITLRHLQKDIGYQFVLLADVVTASSMIGYEEQWYQMSTHRYDTFYLLTNGLSDDTENNVVRIASFQVKPDNQTIQVESKTMTVNGFLRFTNTSDIVLLRATVTHSNSVSIERLATKGKDLQHFSIDFPGGIDVYFPVTATSADTTILSSVSITTPQGEETTNVTIDNMLQRPFVATFDCATQKITNCQYY